MASIGGSNVESLAWMKQHKVPNVLVTRVERPACPTRVQPLFSSSVAMESLHKQTTVVPHSLTLDQNLRQELECGADSLVGEDCCFDAFVLQIGADREKRRSFITEVQ